MVSLCARGEPGDGLVLACSYRRSDQPVTVLAGGRLAADDDGNRCDNHHSYHCAPLAGDGRIDGHVGFYLSVECHRSGGDTASVRRSGACSM